ncbi:nucleotidyltransferase substrate binding protein [Spirochaeta africana]|uniref:Nucleotidyltransferase substrate binding protein, HI0074 family n=1 Tax=Spirochaeta africana (strain ATCC 700263 / DSM 8902 / Z-7692) TaxID=889378 RepID=H9UF58_SPIAZ|nr:nucleotidyltransferase substrate binding protein [Spirochaeta africana]AFG36151.1 nucleotidyltransferase substrate binding protein, HI0074 family [Spirochaeta africana DSM 8902]
MHEQDTRWQQRYQNFANALAELRAAVEADRSVGLNRLEAMGMIQAFEFTYELGWKMMKDYLQHQGIADLVGSRDTIREAVTQGILTEAEGTTWLEMLQDRNRTSHIYNEDTMREIRDAITGAYFPAFEQLGVYMASRFNR